LNWTGGSVPTATDTAVLGALGGGAYTVVSRSGTLGLALGGTQTAAAINTAANATLEIVGDVDALDLLSGDTTYYATSGAGVGVNAGTIVVQDAVLAITILGVDHLLGASATFKLGGSFDNTGTLAINGRPHLLGLLDADQTSTVAIVGATSFFGGGQVTMTNEKLNFISGTGKSSVLTNVDNTIVGAGYIGHGALTFVNKAAGVVDAQGSARLDLKSRNPLLNAGNLEASKHGSLVIYSTTVVNSGTIDGMQGGRIVLQSADIEGGLVEGTGNGYVVTNSANSLIDGSNSAVTLAGQIRVRNGTGLTLAGNIDNTGKISIEAILAHPELSTLRIADGGVTLTGGGQVVSTNESLDHLVGDSTTATLTNVDNRIALAGVLGGGSLTLINEAQGRIISARSSGLTINTGSNVIENAGVIATMGGSLHILSAVDNTGVVEAISGALIVKGDVTGSGTARDRGQTLEFDGAFTEDVLFLKGTGGATSGTLRLGESVGYNGTITGFSKSGATTLDLRDIGFGSMTTASYSGTSAGGVLTVTDGTNTAQIHLAGNFLSSTFTVASDGHGGTSVTDPTARTAAKLASAMAQMAGPTAGSVLSPAHTPATSLMLASPAGHA
jgi:hypothetical protein